MTVGGAGRSLPELGRDERIEPGLDPAPVFPLLIAPQDTSASAVSLVHGLRRLNCN